MRNKETGEFELVVGDKQLLFGFFIGIMLLAVVFAMGYVLGQNSPKSAKLAPDSATTSASASPVDGRPPAAAPPSAQPAVMDAGSAPTAGADPTQTNNPPADTPPQPTTMAARDPGPAAATPAVAAPAKPVDPPNASFWQVAAISSRNSADAMYQSLKTQGFPVTTRPGPNNLTLVWVGPYTDKESLVRAKKQLEDAGLNPVKRP